MPLSEHEQRLLEQMERALYAEDPKFASTLRGAEAGAIQRRRMVVGSLGLLVGLGLLLAGVSLGWPLGVAGFLVMLASAWWMLTSWRGRADSAKNGSPGARPGRGKQAKGKQPKSSQPVMNRFEERWRRRREGGES